MTKCFRPMLAAVLVLALSGCAGSADAWGVGQGGAPPDPPDPAETTGSKVVVYNVAGAFGCLCNVMAGKMARQTVEEVFAADLAAGRVVWREVTSNRRPDLAQRYGVKGSAILVVGRVSGKDVSHRTLDRVCQLYLFHDPFQKYVTSEVNAVLAQVKQQSEGPVVSGR